MRDKRYNVIALGARDYYQVAVALDRAGLLNHLITDFYCPDWLRGIVKNRYCEELRSGKTHSLMAFSFAQALLKLFNYFGRQQKYSTKLFDRSFGFISGALTYFGTNRAVVYSYYLVGFTSFYRLIRRRPATLICFQVHPTAPYIKAAMERDTNRFRSYADVVFRPEPEEAFDPQELRLYKAALLACDHVICASTSTKRSIDFIGGNIRASVVPYGSKFSNDQHREWHPRLSSDKIRFISVCQLVQRKGLHWAFVAMAKLPSELQSRFEWTVVAGVRDESLIELMPTNVHLRSGLSNDELAKLITQSDMFVMPSVIEGFGLVYVESLSLGTPIIYTNETGPADFCIDGKHGFSVGCSSIDELVQVFATIAGDPARIFGMRSNCLDLAATITWAGFQQGVQKVCIDAL